LSDWLVSISGTPAGSQLALYLAVFAALMHAIFGAIQKGRHDPWLTRGAIDINYSLMALPVALFVVPFPEIHMWPIFITAALIHFVYKILQAMAYERGAYTVVYPVVRGISPLITVIAAGLFFQEYFGFYQWLGVLGLTGGILALGGLNLITEKVDKATLGTALLLALLTGVFVAIYTTYDAYGIRLALDPFTFLAWFFTFEFFLFPWVSLYRYRRMENPPDVMPLLQRGFIGGIVAYLSFGSILIATRLDKVGEAAAIRETSVVFAALIGWLFLKEKVGILRTVLIAFIAASAVLVEFGG
jgi:drug/metabolite transporter (DMT)-like permease